MRVYHGNIISCDKNNTLHQYLVENKGIIEYTGNTLPEQYHSVETTELGEKALIPSFVDSHIHFSAFSFFLSNLDVTPAKDFSELEDLVRSFDKKNNKILIGYGASAHSVKEKRLMTREELDRMVPNKPAYIVKYDGHAAIANSKMLEILPEITSSLRGYHADSGELNQEAFFEATDFLSSKVPPLALVKNLLKGIDEMAARGFGMMHPVEGIGYPRDLDLDMARFLAKGQKTGFQIRVFFQTMDVQKVLKRKLPRIGGCFVTALDGCFGSEDAALLAPYSNNADNSGVLFYSDDEVIQFTKEANRAGLQIEVHAIGDAAFKQAVTALEAALKDYPREDHRHSIIHVCLAAREDLEKCASLGIGIAAQPAFLHWEQEPLEYIEQIMGKRAYDISPLRDMLDMGIHISGGSDGPCTHPDPIKGIFAACNHYVPEQSITIEEALKMFTYEGAHMSFDEKERGSLEQNKIADMIILNKNPLTMDTKKLLDLKVEELILSGKLFKPGQGVPSLLWKGLWGGSKKI
ncbi:MAG: amidohydrolase [bacterium]|nr:amidohydrolase [bacterium]